LQLFHPIQLKCLTLQRLPVVGVGDADQLFGSLVDAAAIKAGKVRKTAATICNASEWTLSNGLKVVVLPTEYKKDEVLLNLNLPGGKSLIEDADLYSFDDNILSCINRFTGVGKFSASELPKALSGKIASMSPYFEDSSHGISGSAAPKDIETALQLLYLNFMEPRFDEGEFKVAYDQLRNVLPNIVKMPQMQFQMHLFTAMHNEGARNFFISEEVLDKAGMEAYARVYTKTLFKDTAGAVLYIVGNVDIDSIKPLVEKYAGALPKGKKAASYIDRGERLRGGQFEDRFAIAMETPKVSVFQFYNAPFGCTVEDRLNMRALDYVLQMLYTDTLREEEGGTYGAQVAADYERVPEKKFYLYTAFDTNVEQAPALEELAKKGLREIAQNGPSDDFFTRTVEFFKAQLPQQRINNGYWLNDLMGYYRFAENNDADTEAAINALTKEKIAATAAKLLESGNFTTVTMSPEAK